MIDESFGVIPLRKKKSEWEVFIVYHKSGKYWGFPKGHADSNETFQESAIRELKEETNLEPVKFIQEDPFIEKYEYFYKGKKISKTVLYYLLEVKGEVHLQKEEIVDGRWLPFEEAIKILSFSQAKSFCQELEKITKNI